MNAYLSDAIPIYYGAPDISKYMNTTAIIVCQPPHYHCIQEIEGVDNSALLCNTKRYSTLVENANPFAPLEERIESLVRTL